MHTQKVLLLNASYEPLNVCSWKRAVILILKGKAVEVEQSRQGLSHKFQVPLVIRLQYYVKVPHKCIPMTRKNLMHRDKYTCQYCGKHGYDLTIDHVMPRSRGGTDEWENVVVACHRCNVKKGNRTPDEANMPLKGRAMRPINFASFELSKQAASAKEYLSWQKYMYGT